jgi:hypothetical protein
MLLCMDITSLFFPWRFKFSSFKCFVVSTINARSRIHFVLLISKTSCSFISKTKLFHFSNQRTFSTTCHKITSKFLCSMAYFHNHIPGHEVRKFFSNNKLWVTSSDEHCKLCNIIDIRAFIHSYGESFIVFRNITQLNPQIICSVIYAFSHCVSCETNTLLIYSIRTHNFGSFDQTFFNKLPTCERFSIGCS